MGLYNYLTGFINLGVGVENRGLVRSQTLPIWSIYGPDQNVQRSLGPTAPGYVKLQQRLVPVSLLGGGTYLAGTVDLQMLSEMAKASAPQ